DAMAALKVGARRLAAAPGQPLSAIEAARAEAPRIPFAVIDGSGAVLAVVGADAGVFRTPPGAATEDLGSTASGDAILARLPTTGDRTLTALVVPPFATMGV